LADDVVENHGFVQTKTRTFGRKTKCRVHKTVADSTALFDFFNDGEKFAFIYMESQVLTALLEGFCVGGEGKAKD
jgi:hypothetical protein